MQQHSAPQPTRVATLIVCFNGKPYLEDCLTSLFAHESPQVHNTVVVVDNASRDGSAEFLAERFPAERYPRLVLVHSAENLGFSGGNNLGWSYVREHLKEVRFLALLNQDTVVETGWLEALLEALSEDSASAAAQPKILLDPETHLLNTAGNCSHYLGFGFTTGYREEDRGQYDQPRRLSFPSGAAVVLRCSFIERWGLFDDGMFLYLEDTDLGWRVLQAGLHTVYQPRSRVRHKYRFNDQYTHYYYLERNRWLLLLYHYRLATLLLLAPALVAMEFGQILFAAQHGCLGQKMKAYSYFLHPRNLSKMIRRRCWVQRQRVCGDHHLMAGFLGRLDFQAIQSPLVKYFASPMLAAYWKLIKPCILW